jgi:hypothetical protein
VLEAAAIVQLVSQSMIQRALYLDSERKRSTVVLHLEVKKVEICPEGLATESCFRLGLAFADVRLPVSSFVFEP